MGWRAAAFVVLALALAPVRAMAATSPLWIGPTEQPGALPAASVAAGCAPLTLWVDGPPASGTWVLRPVGGAADLPVVIGTWSHESSGLGAVASGIAPAGGSYVLTLSGGLAAERPVTVDCPSRAAAQPGVAAAPAAAAGSGAAALAAPAQAPAIDAGPGLVAGCLLLTLGLLLGANRRWPRALS